MIGNLHLLKDKSREIHQILHSLSSIYGPIMHLKFGSHPVLVVSSSDMARECLKVNDKSFSSHLEITQAEHLGYNYSILGWAP